MHRRSRLTALAAATAALTACSATPELVAAPQADGPACASALARLPAKVLGRARTPLTVAGAASWGEPAIVLRCGLPALGPTRLDCMSVNGVDWVIDSSGDPVLITTFGRSPAVEVRIPVSYGPSSAADAAVDLSAVATALPRDSHVCIG